MKNRSILLGISFLCVGILVMPFTVSLFATQHTWVAGADVDCTAVCHNDLLATVPGAGDMHFGLVGAGGSAYCKECHQIDAGWFTQSTGNTGDGLFDDEHVAVTVECLDCHNEAQGAAGDVWYTSPTDDAPGAKAFMNNASEAHSPMVGDIGSGDGAEGATLLAGNNEACIVCHTAITVVIGPNAAPSLEYGAATMFVNGTEDSSGAWIVTFEASGP